MSDSPTPRPRRPGSRSGFTLVEIMLVLGIMGIVVGMGMPSIMSTLRKEPLRQAVEDVVTALERARAQAILGGVPAAMVLQAGDGVILVPGAAAASSGMPERPGAAPPAAAPNSSADSGAAGFQARLHPDVLVSMIDVNLRDHMRADSARVRFFPNGTSDDFTLVLEHQGSIRKISLDAVTGQAKVDTLR